MIEETLFGRLLESGILPLAVTLTSALMAFLLSVLARSRRKDLESRRIKIKSEIEEAQKNAYPQYYPYTLGKLQDAPISAVLPLAEINQEIERRTRALDQRIQVIEDRFPSDATIEKISSVNDAILATNLESLTRSVSKLEEKLLSKWDVAVIVFEIIAALGGLTALIITIISVMS